MNSNASAARLLIVCPVYTIDLFLSIRIWSQNYIINYDRSNMAAKISKNWTNRKMSMKLAIRGFLFAEDEFEVQIVKNRKLKS